MRLVQGFLACMTVGPVWGDDAERCVAETTL